MNLLILLQSIPDTLSLYENCTSGGCGSGCGHLTIQALVAAFLAVTFLQSSLDKIVDRKGNLEFLTGHFANSPLKGMVPLLLLTITLLELASGALSAVGLAMIFVNGCNYYIFLGSLLAAISILCLFTGQRLAKDYAGAASLVPYFLVAILGIYFCAS